MGKASLRRWRVDLPEKSPDFSVGVVAVGVGVGTAWEGGGKSKSVLGVGHWSRGGY